MQEIGAILKDWFYVIGVGVAAVLWFGRLESRSKQNQKDIARETAQRVKEMTRLEEKLDKQRDEDRAERDRTWKEIHHSIEIIHQDIKELLQRTSK